MSEQAWLQTELDERTIRIYPLPPQATVGRGQDCYVRLDDGRAGDPHCTIVRGESGFRIRDHGSPAGTEVNGRFVREATLRSGDVVRIGSTIFTFRCLNERMSSTVQRVRGDG